MRLIMPIIIFSIFACLFLVGCEERTVSVEGIFERVEYVGDRYSNTIIYFQDGSTFVIKDKHVSIPVSRGVKMKISYRTDDDGYQWDLKIEKIE